MHVNRNIVVLLCLAWSCTKLWGQYPTVRERVINLPVFDERFLHYGYFLGVNQYDFKFQYTADFYNDRSMGYTDRADIEVEQSMGFQVGLIGDMRLASFANLRIEPGLYYNQRNLKYPENFGLDEEVDRFREVRSTNIRLPLVLKLSAKRINNFRPFVLAGAALEFDLSSNEKNKDDNASGIFRTTAQNTTYELGFGFDFYLFYFKFSPSIRGIFMLNDQLVQDTPPNDATNNWRSPWTGFLKQMQTRAVVLTFTFE